VRAVGLIVMLLIVASCGVASAPRPVATDVCRLPVWWGEPEDITPQFIHAAFIGVPSGKITDAGRLPAPTYTEFEPVPAQFAAASYLSSGATWLRLNRTLLSPDGTQFVYWTYATAGQAPAIYELHVVTVAARDDRVIYRGAAKDVYLPMAFESGAIYLGHQVLNLKSNQLVVDSLYVIKPEGGSLNLVPGSGLPNTASGWSLISDGAAWEVEWNGGVSHSSVYRLDLTTHAVSDWYDTPSGIFEVSAQGVDTQGRLYVSYEGHLVRVDRPGMDVELPPPPGFTSGSAGWPPLFEADRLGAWFARGNGVWLYPAQGDPQHYPVGLTRNIVYPAGPCT